MTEPPKPPRPNRLNGLTAREWLKFQKSWFIHNPPPRKKGVLRHPAKFPETLVQEFVEFFTKPGQWVLDPMAGTGSTLVACLRSGRNAIGVELNPAYAQIAQQVLSEELAEQEHPTLQATLLQADARSFPLTDLPTIDYVITSPPYWDMLRMKGAKTQQERRNQAEWDVFYSDSPDDLGNIADYEQFLTELVSVYTRLAPCLRIGAYLTIIVKNVKKGGTIYPLAWDLARLLGKTYKLKDEKIWCQDNIPLAPYGLGNAWVSNTFHQYCLQFRNE
ncbi:MAG TPA: DNA methyltransferase [Anaerolineales bacterium]|nr:DNA methyltransferase [Anaerolineales bacterium]